MRRWTVNLMLGLQQLRRQGINTTTVLPPQIVDEGASMIHSEVDGGYRTTCGVLTSRVTILLGSKHSQRHRGRDGQPSVSPVLVSNLSNGDKVQNIPAGKYYACASFTDGSIRCWGDNAMRPASLLDQSLSAKWASDRCQELGEGGRDR